MAYSSLDRPYRQPRLTAGFRLLTLIIRLLHTWPSVLTHLSDRCVALLV